MSADFNPLFVLIPIGLGLAYGVFEFSTFKSKETARTYQSSRRGRHYSTSGTVRGGKNKTKRSH